MYTFAPHDWLQNFRMSQETFTYLCNQLRPRIMRRNSRFHTAISVEQSVAITIWCLATPCEYRTIGHLFGVARSTICVVVHEVCKPVVKVLQPKYIQFPTGDQLQTIVAGFEELWNIPQCVGAIDSSHMPVLAPTGNHTDYYNCKGWYSVLVQGTVAFVPYWRLSVPSNAMAYESISF